MKICSIEGLGNTGVLNRLCKEIVVKYGLEHKRFAWDADLKTIRRWQDESDSIVLGHSFGGETSVKYASRTASIYTRLLITFDPRYGSKPFGSYFDSLFFPWQGKMKYTGTGKAINFYQRGFLPGYKVIGAENHFVWGQHHTIPYKQHVKQIVFDAIESIL